MANTNTKNIKTIQSLRGMKDIVNEESSLFTYFVENASKIAKNYGFTYIETPLLEETALFKRSVGESSDIVNKEMYQFIDKGENDVCLRPEGTAGVVRHFVEKKLDRAGGNYKWYYYILNFLIQKYQIKILENIKLKRKKLNQKYQHNDKDKQLIKPCMV